MKDSMKNLYTKKALTISYLVAILWIKRTIFCFEFLKKKKIFILLPERKFHFIYIKEYSLDYKEALFFLSNHRQTRP